MTENAQQKPQASRISISSLRKVYGSGENKVVAIDDVNLEIREGEFFCILGPSGCGKSTLLRILSGLIDANGGTLEIDDDDIGDDEFLSSMVFQEYGIFPWKSVMENVSFGLKMKGVEKDEREQTAQKYIDKVNLSGFEDSYPHQLSGGMKQRVGIARAFANDPDILFLDEPFGALDAQTKQILQTELLSIWNESKKTAVYITHDIDEALILADRIGVMTSRPGSIKEVIDNELDRPRDREIRSSNRYSELHDQVWEILRDEVQASMRE